MTDYIATQKITGGPYDGQALSAVHPTITGFGEYDFTWTLADDFADFASLGVIGFKVVGQFDGTGEIVWNWEANDPGYPSAPEWPIDSGSGHLTLESAGVAAVEVSGLTAFEWVFALTDTAADPTYVGNTYLDPLHDVEISLHATTATRGFDHTVGTIAGNGDGTAVEVLRWDLVLFTELVTGTGDVVVTRLYPRDDALGLGTANRLVPPPRAGRIVGRQP